MSTLNHTDAYKLSHKGFMGDNTEYIYSNMTPRAAKHLPIIQTRFDNKAVFFGLQYFIKDYLIKEWNEKFFSQPREVAIAKFKRRTDTFLGPDSVSMEHFEELHKLGYLPISIKALPEGARVNLRVPFFTIVNTHPRFAWLTNYLETIISCEIWKPSTTATIAFELRKMVEQFALETTGNNVGVKFQCHGFEFRGMSGRHDAAISGSGHLLSFWGTDTIPAIDLLEEYYKANAEKELIAASVPASEHMVTSLGIATIGELEFYRRAITEAYPTGIVSIVADTLDFFEVITTMARELKQDILNRKPNAIGLAKVVFRPDSGNPVRIIAGDEIPVIAHEGKYGADTLEKAVAQMEEIVVDEVSIETPHGECGDSSPVRIFKYRDKHYKIAVEIEWNRHDKQYYYIDGSSVKSVEAITLTPEQKGAVECLWEIFGGTVTAKGYKVLHERVGLIYGDSITQEIAEQIFSRLKAKGFASTNVVLGIGSYTYNYLTRDCLGMAIKGTWAQVDGKGIDLYKDPKTDSGVKKSARGLLRVDLVDGQYVLTDRVTPEQEKGGELKEVFRDGKLLRETSLEEIRARIDADVTASITK